LIRRTIILLVVLGISIIANGQNVYFNNTYDVGLNANGITSVIQDPSDSSYLVTGNYPTFPGQNMYVMRLDQYGDTLWSKHYGDSLHELYSGSKNSISLIGNGFLVVGSVSDTSGYTNSILLKFNHDGDTVFTRRYDYSEWDIFRASHTIDDNQILMVGSTRSGSSYDLLLVKVDSLGSEIWQQQYGTTTGWESGYSVDHDGTNILVGGGKRNSSGGAGEIYMVKTDLQGNQEWEETFGQTDEAFGSVQICDDGNYLAVGSSIPDTSNNRHSLLAKITPNKVKLWEKVFPISGGKEDVFGDAVTLTNGDVVATGQTWNDEVPDYYVGFIIRTNSEGEMIWKRDFQGRNKHTYVFDMEQTLDGGFVVAGYVSPDDIYTQDGWVIKLDSMGCEMDSCWYTGVDVVNEGENKLNIFPNPARDMLTVLNLNQQEIAVYNLTGKREAVLAIDNQINVSYLPNGIYFLQVGEETRKFVISR
jgi:hypothetical protein